MGDQQLHMGRNSITTVKVMVLVTVKETMMKVSAALYYASNSLTITEVVNALEDEASSIVAAKKLLNSSEMKNDLTFVAAEFGFLLQVICQLQERGQPLTKSVKIVDDAVQRMDSVPVIRGSLVKEQCKNVFSKNCDLDKLRNISKILQAENPYEIQVEDITTPLRIPQTPSTQGHLVLPNSSPTDTSFEELSSVPMLIFQSGGKRVRKSKTQIITYEKCRKQLRETKQQTGVRFLMVMLGV
ncbi:hypothetical protein ANN_03387 [Periplaneta americana]|uniref:Uncharacterized protein n=1 Tax=Periplaneta americana TaxID=6978 RepID=A0ABQ8U304_PERAM|nr:hypothetical protein ANN_03387 [Periplaneta americana]